MKYIIIVPVILSLSAFCSLSAEVLDADGVISWRSYSSNGVVQSRLLRSSVDSRITDEQRSDALVYLNTMRTGAGLIPFSANALLDQAIQNHMDYLILNDTFSHYEDSEKSGYTGEAPWDRGEYAGYNYRAYGENISAGDETVIESIDGLMTAIYHRFGFLTFSLNEIGVGGTVSSGYAYGSAYGFDMGNQGSSSDTEADNPAYVVWPHDGYKSAQTSFNNYESPDPVPECPRGGIVANPVSIQFNSAKSGSIVMQEFKLFNSDGSEIIETKVSDFGSGEFALFAMHSLSLDSQYRALFTYKEDDVAKNVSWSFNTKRYELKRYEVHEGGSYNIIAGNEYILHLKADDCNTTMQGYGYSGNMTSIQRLGSDIYKIKADGDISFTSPLSFTLKISQTDDAIAPSSQSDILDLYMMGVLPAIIAHQKSAP
jgi:uncharacterized protein YkwD